MKLSRRLAALVAVAALTGCSDDDPEPKLEPSEAPTSPAATASTPPETSEPPEPLGPEETLRAWVDARNQALADGVVTGVSELSDQSCASCRDLFEPIAETYEQGGSIDTDGWRVVSMRVKSQSSGKAEARAAVRFAPGTRTPPDDADPITFEAERHLMIFRMAKRGGTWLITLVGFIS